jgi:hypothetical protein
VVVEHVAVLKENRPREPSFRVAIPRGMGPL